MQISMGEQANHSRMFEVVHITLHLSELHRHIAAEFILVSESYLDMSFTVAAVQLDSRNDKKRNVDKMSDFVDEAAKGGADIVVFPELVTYIGSKDRYGEIAEEIPGPTIEMLQTKAQEHDIYIHSGSFIEKSTTEGKFYNTSAVIDDTGEILDIYRKIHLFDVTIGDEVVTQESEKILPGDNPTVVETDLGTFGLSICYDIRFPELYATLTSQGADVLFIPAAFTMFTGKDHWQPLLRARAIENQAYVIAPGQIGDKPIGIPTYGKSMIVDPWGNVISQASDQEQVVFASIDPTYTTKVREELPSLTHKRPDAYNVSTDSDDERIMETQM